MKRIPSGRAAALMLAVALSVPAHATDPFVLDIAVYNVDNVPAEKTFGYSSLEEAIDKLDFSQLQNDFSYGGTEQVSVEANLRGLSALLDFANNSNSLLFVISGVAIDPNDADGNGTDHVTFDGRTRQESIRMLKDFLKGNKAALKALLTRFAQISPIDPLAGNPDSLFGQRMKNDFNHGFTNKVSQVWGCSTTAFNFSNDSPLMLASAGETSGIFADAQARAAQLQAQNELSLGFSVASTKSEGAGTTYGTNTVTLPFSYTAKLDSDPRKKVRVDLPLTYVDTEGAKSYSMGLGLAYTHPLADEWSLTPGISVGATGSQDLGSGGGVLAYSLTSAYTWRLPAFAVSMGNAVGQYKSLGIKIGDIEAEADINNTVFTNGLLLTGPDSLIAKNLVVEYSLIDTRITGDTVYSDSSDEIGVSIGRISTENGVIDSYTKVGLGYLMAKGASGDINSLRLTLVSRF